MSNAKYLFFTGKSHQIANTICKKESHAFRIQRKTSILQISSLDKKGIDIFIKLKKILMAIILTLQHACHE